MTQNMIQNALNYIDSSDFSEESKARMKKVLEGKDAVTPGMENEIKDIMQAEIDKDFAEEGIDISQEPEVKEIQNRYDSALEKIESELAEEQKFVGEQIQEVEKMSKEVLKLEDEIKAEELKQKILNSM